MKKISLFSIAALTAVLMFTQISFAEARSHTRVQVGVGSQFHPQRTIVRQYSRPVVVAAPAFQHPPSYYYCPETRCYVQAPVMTPVYIQQAPVYVEEVYVAPRPIGFGGLSFSWNWFK